MEIFLLANLITLIMLIWLKSDAIVAWGSFIGLSKLLSIQEFYDRRLETVIKGWSINYPEFLEEKYDYNFITKMLACPLCLSVWLSILSCIIISIISLSWFIFLFLPTICILSLITYGVITLLIKL